MQVLLIGIDIGVVVYISTAAVFFVERLRSALAGSALGAEPQTDRAAQSAS